MEINFFEIWLNYIWPTIKVVSIVTSLITPAIVFYVKTKIESKIKRAEYAHNSRWEIKRKACFDALKIIDGYCSNVPWSVGQGKNLIAEQQLKPEIEQVRECHNALTVSCDNSDVLDKFMHCIGAVEVEKIKSTSTKLISPDNIHELRMAIRKELGLNNNLSAKHAFIMSLEIPILDKGTQQKQERRCQKLQPSPPPAYY